MVHGKTANQFYVGFTQKNLSVFPHWTVGASTVTREATSCTVVVAPIKRPSSITRFII